MNPEIFREYDIRGIVDKDFDEAFAYQLGRAFASYLDKNETLPRGKVSVGYDARLSSPRLAEALASGLSDSGVDVLTLGLITSPLSYFSTFTLPLSGGLMVTGSHNPPNYNGFKISLGTSSIFGAEIQKIKDIVFQKNFLPLPASKGTVTPHDLLPAYIDKYGSDIKLSKNFSPIRAVVDCGNGAAGVVVRRLYDRIGINCEFLFEEPDGRFPNHHPDPTVEENIFMLKKRVTETKASVGIGFDGDADRIAVVDHTGRALFGDELMVLFSRSVLEKFPGTPVIGDVKCSDRLYDDIAKHGGQPVMYKTGHSLIKDKMKELKSKFSGEMSGHVFFADRNFGYDDAIYAGARVIEIMSQTGKTIPQLLEGLPKAFSTPEIRIDTTEEKKLAIVASIKARFGNGEYKVNEIDGIRISFEDGFALVRSSNTQPVIVCRFEAQSEKRLAEIRDLVEGAVKRLL